MPQETYPIKYATEKNGQRILPVTSFNAVRDTDGNTLAGRFCPEGLGFGISPCNSETSPYAVTITNFHSMANSFIVVNFKKNVEANATLSVNGLQPVAIYLNGSPVEVGDINAGDTVLLAFNGSHYECIVGNYPENTLLGDNYIQGPVMPDFNGYTDTVHNIPQTLTEEEKAQARDNIDAQPAVSIVDIEGKTYKELTW